MDSMRSVTAMRVAKTGYIVIGLALVCLGLVLLTHPDASLSFFNRLFGITAIVYGGIKLVGFFSKDLYRLAFQHDMAAGILLIAMGIFTLAHPDAAVSVYCIAFGIVILTDGLLKIQIALDARTFGIHSWWVLVTLAILSCVGGILLIFRPMSAMHAIVVLGGLTLLIEGGLTLCVALMTVKIVHHQRPDII